MVTMVKLIKVLLIWFVGRWVLKRVVNLLKLIMAKHIDNESVRGFVISIIDVVVMIMLILMIIGVLGIDTSSFIAIFASAGVAIGMAILTKGCQKLGICPDGTYEELDGTKKVFPLSSLPVKNDEI